MPTNKESDKYKYIDYLSEDMPIEGQSHVCLSFISPEGIKNCKTRGLKIRGVYGSEEEAKARCEELNAIDPDFDVFVGEVGKWLPWNPDPTEAKNQVYREKELNDIVQGHQKNLHKAKQIEAERKADLLKNAISEEKSRKELVKEQDAKKLEKTLEKKENRQNFINKALDKLDSGPTSATSQLSKAHKKKLKNKNNKIKDLVEDVDERKVLADNEGARLRAMENNISTEKAVIDDVDKDIEKIKNLYSKLKEKQQQKTQQHMKNTK